MNTIKLSVAGMLAFLFMQLAGTVTVTGRITGRSGEPVAGAKLVYTGVETGKVYTVKTDKNGQFDIAGVFPGNYTIVVTDGEGKKIFTGRKHARRPNEYQHDENQGEDNVHNIDLSTVVSGDAIDPEGNMGQGKLNKEQLALVRKENAESVRINRMVIAARGYVDAQDWPHATETFRQLILLDPNRWEFYQNLATIEGNQSHYPEAAAMYQKGIAVAEKTLANTGPQARDSLGLMMVMLGDANMQMGHLQEAMEAYAKAAVTLPNPVMPLLRACNAQSNNSNHQEAIELCGRALAADPRQLELYQTLATVQKASGQSDEALATLDRGIASGRRMLETQPQSARVKNAIGQMLTAEGNLYSQLKDQNRAIASFTEASELSAYPALPLGNLCVSYYNSRHLQESLDACNKAIASDPSLPDPYYIKGVLLFGKGREENGRYTVPAETREALRRYLALSPSGDHAVYVREMLGRIDGAVSVR